MNPQQLKECSLEEAKNCKDAAVTRKAELEALKAKGGKAWTNELQDELNEVALFLVDVDDAIEEKTALDKSEVAKPSYIPAKGTEKMVHLSIVRGRRFNSNTGKEESIPYVQLFTFSEWQLFQKNFRNLGYSILAVLHDPYGDAAKFIVK